MSPKEVNRVIKLLKESDVIFNEGLTDNETERVENTFNFIFPPDLRLFLQTALPVSSGFAHWRYGINSVEGQKEIKNRLSWATQGIFWAVKKDGFWLETWGKKPDEYQEIDCIVKAYLATQPILIPIFSHRYIPSFPNEMGNPIFSVHGIDIIHYGFDLLSYFANEFRFELPFSIGRNLAPKPIPFWSDLVD